MEIWIKIETGNAAFESENTETTRILKELASKLEYSFDDTVYLRDYNGNKVGFCACYEKPQKLINESEA